MGQVEMLTGMTAAAVGLGLANTIMLGVLLWLWDRRAIREKEVK